MNMASETAPARNGSLARAAIEAVRPKQWIKNLIVFAALIFGRHISDRSMVETALVAFALFCLLSSSVYLINDSLDARRDRQHPKKRFRPIASGRLPVSYAVALAAILAVVGVGLSFWVNLGFGLLALTYLVLETSYSFFLKHIVIVDVMTIAIGFVLRAAGGGAAIGVVISPWLLVCTILLALFLALSKRRHELVLLEDNAQAHRRSLSEYTPYLLDQMINVVTASTVVSYSLYTMSPETVEKFDTHALAYTIPFVIFGVFRYLYLVHQKGEGGDPERIPVTDKPFIINIALWLATVAVVLYWQPRWLPG